MSEWGRLGLWRYREQRNWWLVTGKLGSSAAAIVQLLCSSKQLLAEVTWLSAAPVLCFLVCHAHASVQASELYRGVATYGGENLPLRVPYNAQAQYLSGLSSAISSIRALRFPGESPQSPSTIFFSVVLHVYRQSLSQ